MLESLGVLLWLPCAGRSEPGCQSHAYTVQIWAKGTSLSQSDLHKQLGAGHSTDPTKQDQGRAFCK